MIPLLLSILSSSLIYVVFKLLGKYKVDSLQAIVVNYITACLIGIYGHFEITGLNTIFSETWFLGSVVLGCLFIMVFNLMMIVTAQRNGMSVVSVASKMSVALSIIFVIFYYNEEPGILKISGILLALVAV
ncbi:MAG TPA: EamA family transporter, partial [Salinimicrobium sp.]|nr:EamA family transporter [Salinimicrobium sp.]